MTNDSKIVKDIIKTFVEEHSKESTTVHSKSGEQFLANKAIFELESYLVRLRNDYKINARIDTSIFSQNILAHFSSVDAGNAFSSIHYEYNFLHHLAASYAPKKDLHTLIDEFITKFKEQFTLADIVLTATGATRCKTNIRFALNNLRDFGFVISKDKNDKRSWSPSVIGLVALLNIELCKPESEKWNYYREPQRLYSLGNNKYLNPNAVGDPLLLHSISYFKQPDFLYCYLTWKREIALDESEKVLLENILDQYVEFRHEGLALSKNGVKQTDKFKELSKEFQLKLFNIQDNNPELLEKLFKHFKAIP